MPKQSGSDKLILLSALVLSGMGAIMVYSASAIMSMERYSDPYYFFKRQIMYIGVGLVLMIAAMNIDYRHYRSLTIPLLGAAFVLMVLVFIPPIGKAVNGAARWIQFKMIRLQPSEIAKFALIVYASHYISKKRERMKDFKKGLMPLLIVIGLFFILLMKQPDFGTVVTIAAVITILLFVGGMSIKYVFAVILFAVPAIVMAVVLAPYRMKRWTAFMDPWADAQGSGFQIIQSMYAFARGGFWGLGFGEGREKLFYLPAPHNDFILAVIGEEIGMIGVVTVIGLLFLYMYRGVMVAMRTNDMFGMLLAVGIAALIGFQGVVNIAVNVGLMPTKGIPLPFVSYGGSSILFSLFSTGVLLNISEHA